MEPASLNVFGDNCNSVLQDVNADHFTEPSMCNVWVLQNDSRYDTFSQKPFDQGATLQHQSPLIASFDPYFATSEVQTVFANTNSPAMRPDYNNGPLLANSVSSSSLGSPRSVFNPPPSTSMLGWATPDGAIEIASSVTRSPDYFTLGPELTSPSAMEECGFDFAHTKLSSYGDPGLTHHSLTPALPLAPPPTYQHTYSSSGPTCPISPSPSMPGVMQGPLAAFSLPQALPALDRSQSRRQSLGSLRSTHSGDTVSDSDSKEKDSCPHPDCGKYFKDLRAHMLTHQNERPEKCPITTCEYHIKGFARKYDKNRHTLTHYKGRMVCGFCPGVGTSSEKSFNRADVFKRHLTSVHGVEQSPPNSRKRSSPSNHLAKGRQGVTADTTGKCSCCSETFANAQVFYEHLDECVLQVVQQKDPIEDINTRRLKEVEDDAVVLDTLKKSMCNSTHMSSSARVCPPTHSNETTQEGSTHPSQCGEVANIERPGIPRHVRNRSEGQRSPSRLHSRRGQDLPGRRRSRKSRRGYPNAWGFNKDHLNMKKRVVTVFDGSRRSAKDDLMLYIDHELRIPLSDGKSYVTDLDVQTLDRAQGLFHPTEADRGTWIPDGPTEENLRLMHEMRFTPVGVA